MQCTISHVPYFYRSNYRDSAQTHSKESRRFRCTYVGEREAINRDAYTNMSPMGVVFHESEGGVQTSIPRRGGEEKVLHAAK